MVRSYDPMHIKQAGQGSVLKQSNAPHVCQPEPVEMELDVTSVAASVQVRQRV